MACERYRDALSGLAAGGLAEAAVEAHLLSCEACRGELAGLRQALAVADRELARLVAAEPSPELASRIRAAAAASAGAAHGWRLGWGLPLAAAAAAVVVATVFVVQRGPRPEPPAIVADRAPAQETLRATPVPETVAPASARHSQPAESRPRAASPSRRERAPGPEVLVPVGEAEALVRLAANLRRRSVTPESLLVADLSAPLAEPEVSEIRPIEIFPLDPAESSGAE